MTLGWGGREQPLGGGVSHTQHGSVSQWVREDLSPEVQSLQLSSAWGPGRRTLCCQVGSSGRLTPAWLCLGGSGQGLVCTWLVCLLPTTQPGQPGAACGLPRSLDTIADPPPHQAAELDSQPAVSLGAGGGGGERALSLQFGCPPPRPPPVLARPPPSQLFQQILAGAESRERLAPWAFLENGRSRRGCLAGGLRLASAPPGSWLPLQPSCLAAARPSRCKILRWCLLTSLCLT